MKRSFAAGLVTLLALLDPAFAQIAETVAESAADHSKLKPLMRDFASGPEVTAACLSCHTGYGWEDTRVAAPTDPTAVDCLACHDHSGQYTKQDNLVGHPPLDPVAPGARTITGASALAVDLTRAAQSVGLPGRDNCGNCHVYGGGGDNVKHGDLS